MATTSWLCLINGRGRRVRVIPLPCRSKTMSTGYTSTRSRGGGACSQTSQGSARACRVSKWVHGRSGMLRRRQGQPLHRHLDWWRHWLVPTSFAWMERRSGMRKFAPRLGACKARWMGLCKMSSTSTRSPSSLVRRGERGARRVRCVLLSTRSLLQCHRLPSQVTLVAQSPDTFCSLVRWVRLSCGVYISLTKGQESTTTLATTASQQARMLQLLLPRVAPRLLGLPPLPRRLWMLRAVSTTLVGKRIKRATTVCSRHAPLSVLTSNEGAHGRLSSNVPTQMTGGNTTIPCATL
mmetsp:Transcript_3753/g.8935  ORF Transcript_3753/g.8935 Transcript_3753/m.8935 type:complete len:294 (+) Transcript_3753:770-1651(+)